MAPPGGQTASPAAGASGQPGDGLLRPNDVAGAVFTVTPGESKASYTVHEKLAQLPLPSDAVGTTTQITGAVRLDGGPSKVTVDLRTLKSDSSQRDRFITSVGGLPFNRYPFAEFTVTDLGILPAEYHPGDTVTRTVTGTMKIRDVERPMTFDVDARLQDNVVYVLGRSDFTWSDFQIPPPNVRGIVQVEDNVHIEILIVAKRDGHSAITGRLTLGTRV